MQLTGRCRCHDTERVKQIVKDEAQLMDQVVARLVEHNPGISRDTIEAIVHEEHRKLDGRPVREYVSVLVERSTKTRLQHHGSLIAA